MDLAALQHLLSAIPGVRVACVGDLMVDRFVYGDVSRVSPEAPIPVLARRRELVMLGAAGNVARNVAALGGHVCLVGLVGGDGEGHEALRLVSAEAGVEGFIVSDPDRPTTLKTRFVSGGQQLLRVDNEVATPAQGEVEDRLVRTIRDVAADVGLILLSDYGKGVVTPAVIAACRAAGARVIVDSKARSFARYGAVDIIKPNAAELAHATDMATDTDEEITAALAHALSLCEAQAILVTRSAKGISLAVRGEAVRHFPGVPKEVFDASGAGDTTLAALGLALAAKASMEDAVAFAMLASGVAVGKAGTAVVTPAELMEATLAAHMAPAEAKVATPLRMADEVARWKAKGLRVGFTNGCFDILHKGHVAYLDQARSWCDRLVVGVNDDASVKRLKGEGRPVNDLESRAIVLAGLGSVDLVVPFEEDTPMKLIEAVRPDVLVKGADYSEDQVVGAAQVRAWGGEVKLAQIVQGFSTTAAISRMQDKP
ncbi:D-glycero-beta-D-manno-heptose 1-phosphate adenylyltransferase [Phenylobacterium sp.]|uniref:D-glycero-beta-D-manno-heptose 1-phosphate adenylyltransferase n=1 Tax=Phenylobacterium sp. TaxID=1871053 RepID=UPI00272F13C3|nr:D-glycero-beta-D-manno-heptose 1-phosphate adenylyltransferase [Phenylobacterium sp.]MDP1618409.1 D-glycero-beta-D-manno-heptose 1-phosphate adenylyltransferase [Phenylobacterium sp.]MDP1986166.1 D-glycero-beta-D-manno-heptose 1-phosphate adenylyltransferase [Phenylobacterium sp.]